MLDWLDAPAAPPGPKLDVRENPLELEPLPLLEHLKEEHAFI